MYTLAEDYHISIKEPYELSPFLGHTLYRICVKATSINVQLISKLGDNYPITLIGYDRVKIRATDDSIFEVCDFEFISNAAGKHTLTKKLDKLLSGATIEGAIIDTMSISTNRNIVDAVDYSTSRTVCGRDKISAEIKNTLINNSAYEFKHVRTDNVTVYHALHTSKESPIVSHVFLMGSKVYNRTAATLYLDYSAGNTGIYKNVDSLFAVKDNYIQETLFDVRALDKDTLYRLNLLLRLIARTRGTPSMAIFNTLCNHHSYFTDLAELIDTKLGWDGEGNLPIAASDEYILASLDDRFTTITNGTVIFN